MKKEYITTSELAALSGKSRYTIKSHRANGKFTGCKRDANGYRWLYPMPESLEAIKASEINYPKNRSHELADKARANGIKLNTVYSRLKSGLSEEEAVTAENHKGKSWIMYRINKKRRKE